MTIMQSYIYEFIIVLFNFSLIVFFIWNLNLKAYPPLDLKVVIDNVLKSKPEASNSVGLPDPDEGEKKRKERREFLKKIVIGTVIVIGVIVAGYFGIKYYGGWDWGGSSSVSPTPATPKQEGTPGGFLIEDLALPKQEPQNLINMLNKQRNEFLASAAEKQDVYLNEFDYIVRTYQINGEIHEVIGQKVHFGQFIKENVYVNKQGDAIFFFEHNGRHYEYIVDKAVKVRK